MGERCAKYACAMKGGCGHRWTGELGPCRCPKCGSIYFRWLNYDELFPRGTSHREKMIAAGLTFHASDFNSPEEFDRFLQSLP